MAHVMTTPPEALGEGQGQKRKITARQAKAPWTDRKGGSHGRFRGRTGGMRP